MPATDTETSYRVEMVTSHDVYRAGDDLTLEQAEELAARELARPGRWGRVRIVRVEATTLRYLRGGGADR